MKPLSEDQLAATLSAMRPAPRPAFAAELDARVAAGFPRQSRAGGSALSKLGAKLRSLKPRQVILPVGATAVAAIAIATIVVSNSGSGTNATIDQGIAFDSRGGAESAAPSDSGVGRPSNSSDGGASDSGGGGAAGGEIEYSDAPESLGGASAGAAESSDSASPSIEAGAAEEISPPSNPGNAAGTAQRDVERSAEITLGTEPANVGEAAAEVFDVVHQYRGIVLDSSTTEGAAGDAEAEFNLLIPSAKLGDALAGFSGIAEVRSRHEATTDITAPTVGVSEHLADSGARIDSLLAQLADASSDEEREIVEAELASERGRNANLRAHLERLDRRANLSSVSLRIETGEDSATPEDEGGAWGVGDAFDDAGGILSTAAAVTLVGLAVLGPIALLALLAWIAYRLWTRQSRARALG